MKLSALLLLCATAMMFNACERHHVSELESIKPAEEHGSGAEARAVEPKPETAPETGPAPKYFPEKK